VSISEKAGPVSHRFYENVSKRPVSNSLACRTVNLMSCQYLTFLYGKSPALLLSALPPLLRLFPVHLEPPRPLNYFIQHCNTVAIIIELKTPEHFSKNIPPVCKSVFIIRLLSSYAVESRSHPFCKGINTDNAESETIVSPSNKIVSTIVGVPSQTLSQIATLS
jgi:hypothetical protein